jgi:hypothetical protein
MTGIILAGGPRHGKRLDDPPPVNEYVTTVQPPIPLRAAVKTRPRFWRDPLGWFRFKPGTTIDSTEFAPAPVHHLYRFAGTLKDGTAVYWWQGPYAAEPPFDSADVLRAVWQVAIDFERDHPYVRPAGVQWEMSPQWYAAIRRASRAGTGDPMTGDMLFGYPLRVCTGSPRLVTEDTPG